MVRILEQLKQNKILISDGAWGTLLQGKGLKPGECPELWCVTHRAEVLDIARSYIAAGADMVKTNSFGGNRFKLEFYGLAPRAAELNTAAAAISREAAGPDRHVIASLGPTGKLLLMGDVTEQELSDAFAKQAVALEQGGADAALIESMSALDETCLAIRAVRQNTRLEVISTLTFEKNTRGEYRTMMGVSPADMAKTCLAAGADIIGANCGHGFRQMIDVVKEIRKTAPLAPILVHANAGLPVNRNGVDVFPDTPAMMAEFVPALIEAGANIIGGCCGTTPAHIAAIARATRSNA
ncbi:MAG: homocysteine S-methyltransferase family protein [Verrucomicrobia bacterium]|nr:homocysteine S-methyltransferase family protein [Verrucomicrobiota bacterium]MCG2680652.1 homocysteine S-methyltransferase family protein [Kiritimatiellia bacterium]MBU4247425.1 homocysteine S-methyltransferase family protein [Verrucomicrobiota bacterium]MBU4291483.1 homocysteine S-methyltransferase family protein [Verrucomicrobiota bacterium]MBU4429666.1 homocysteine S-methyltransferase family protein [Verrucomicrobiota bacterium]